MEEAIGWGGGVIHDKRPHVIFEVSTTVKIDNVNF
jgi:hypothetical protein